MIQKAFHLNGLLFMSSLNYKASCRNFTYAKPTEISTVTKSTLRGTEVLCPLPSPIPSTPRASVNFSVAQQ